MNGINSQVFTDIIEIVNNYLLLVGVLNVQMCNKKGGFYIELGANDGLLQSNTAFFEKHMEWQGINDYLFFDNKTKL